VKKKKKSRMMVRGRGLEIRGDVTGLWKNSSVSKTKRSCVRGGVSWMRSVGRRKMSEKTRREKQKPI